MLFTRKSVLSGIERTRDLPVTQEQYDLWKNGTGNESYIQNAMSNLTDSEREFILTGLTDEEWEEEFGKPEPLDPVFQSAGYWFFYDETWANPLGPYSTEKIARRVLEIYNDHLAGNLGQLEIREIVEREGLLPEKEPY